MVRTKFIFHGMLAHAPASVVVIDIVFVQIYNDMLNIPFFRGFICCLHQIASRSLLCNFNSSYR